jgi:eukaryotic-like serine/threonine-protein kinase
MLASRGHGPGQAHLAQPVHAIARAGSDPYWLVMKPDDVRDLRSRVEGGRRLEIDDAIDIIIGCCRALPDADPRGVISPKRILISDDGDVAIGDAEASPEMLGYVAPELVSASMHSARPAQPTPSPSSAPRSRVFVARPTPEGLAAASDPRAAVFALGAILWEMLAGRPLFKGDTDYHTMQLAGAAHVPPLPEAPPELEAIARKALAKRVEDRYQTAGQLADALAGYLVLRAQS